MIQHNHNNDIAPRSGQATIYRRIIPSNHTQALQSRIAELIMFTNDYGYPNERIIVYEDVSVSSRKPQARRKALFDLLAAISQEGQELGPEPIRAIYVLSEHRLFRNLDAIKGPRANGSM